MDIKQLKFLIALDETRHFGQAAARCHITQPTLSMRLRSLEQELDLQLVNRGQRFESFTAPGERVLAWARTVLAAYDGLQAEAAACRGNLIGTLRLGVVPLSSFDPLPLLQHLHQQHPELRFELSALSSGQILEQLASNQLDLGVSYLERLDHERFDALALEETRMGLLYDQRYFSFGEAPLSWEALTALPLALLSFIFFNIQRGQTEGVEKKVCCWGYWLIIVAFLLRATGERSFRCSSRLAVESTAAGSRLAAPPA